MFDNDTNRSLPDTNRPLPDDATKFPPAAYGAGAPADSYASYKLLRSNEWGLSVPGGAKSGDVVVVRRRDNTETRERVGVIHWTGISTYTGKPLSICSIDRGSSQPANRRAPAQQRQRIARRNASRTAATVAAAPVVAASAPTPASQPRGWAAAVYADKSPRSTRPASQRQSIPVFSDGTIDTSGEPTDVDAARHAAEATLGLDEPLF